MRHLLALLVLVGLGGPSPGQDLDKPTPEGLNELKNLTSALESRGLVRRATDAGGHERAEVADAKRLQAFLKDHRDLLTPRLRETLIRTCPGFVDQESSLPAAVMKAVAEEARDRRLAAFAILSQGVLDIRRENFAPALRAFQEAAEAFAALKGHGRWQAACFSQRGRIYELQQRHELALQEFRRALPLYRESLGERDAAVAGCLQSIGSLLSDLHKPDEAMKVLEQAADLYRDVKDDPSAGLSSVYTSMAYLHYEAGRYRQAQGLFEKALNYRIEHLGKDHPETAKAYDNLGEYFTERGDYAGALRCLQSGRAIFERNGQGASLDLAINLSLTATLYERLEDHQKVLELQLRALTIYRRLLPSNHLRVAYALGGVSHSYARCGEYGKCLDYALESLRARRGARGERHPSVVVGLSQVGYAYSRLQDYGRAREYYGRALRLAKELPNCPPSEIGTQHNNLGFVYSQMGEPEQAIREFRAARGVFAGNRQPDDLTLATVDMNIAMQHLKRKEYARALALLQDGLAGFERRFGPRHPEVALTHYNIAAAYFEQGKHAEALRAVDKAVASLRAGPAAGPDEGALPRPGDLREMPLTLSAFALRGRILEQSLGADAPAEEVRRCASNYEFLTALAEGMRRRGVETQTAKLALGEQVAEAYPRLALLYQRLYRLEGKAEHLAAAFRTAELGTARVFLEAYGQSRALDLGKVSPGLREKEVLLLAGLRRGEGLLREAQGRPADLRDAEEIGRLQKDQAALQEKLSAHLARVAHDFPKYAALKYPTVCSLEEARACLAPNEVALSYLLGAEGSCALLVSGDPRGDAVAAFALPPSDQLAEQVSALTAPASLSSTAKTQDLGGELFAALLGPLADRIRGKDLVIVPTGALCYLPFELLVEPGGDGAPRFLVEGHRVRYAPSLTALHLQGRWDKGRTRPGRAFFAVGDPVYDRADSRLRGKTPAPAAGRDRPGEYARREGRPDYFPRLPNSLREVQEIGKLFGSSPEEILTGPRACKREVLRASASDRLARYRYLHFATHGILGVDGGRQPALVLSRVGGEGDDGFLELDEVAGLRLNADLVVLSACRSGQGRLYNGEGAKGLARAFLAAGSRAVVCSLWQVDDRETADLMIQFYTNLKQGQRAAEALHNAQHALLRRGTAPLYWAPFILIGE